MVEGTLSFYTDLSQSSDRADGELTLGRFVIEHDGINTVDNGLADISSLTASRLRHAAHGV